MAGRPARCTPGELTVGELVAFFGYALFMVWPIQTFFELAQKWVRAMVSARKADRGDGAAAAVADAGGRRVLPAGAAIVDERVRFVGRARAS